MLPLSSIERNATMPDTSEIVANTLKNPNAFINLRIYPVFVNQKVVHWGAKKFCTSQS
jgi:hypothetical protein